jgi:acetyltransferase-like isoleucine patch superfamily enzyme
VIGARANIGRGCIINTAASVDHDCIIGDFAHVCPGARLAGDVHVGARTMIGTNATIIPGIRIGADVVIGAGAVVIRNVADGRTVAGNPARVVESRRES